MGTCTRNLCFEQKQEKYQKFSTENFLFLQLLKICLLHGHVFVMYPIDDPVVVVLKPNFCLLKVHQHW